jgi:putative transposase
MRVDNGPGLTSKRLDQWVFFSGVELDIIRPVKPTDISFTKSFNRHFRQECLNKSRFLSLENAREKIEEQRQHYNRERPRGVPRNLAPLGFAAASKATEPTRLKLKLVQ